MVEVEEDSKEDGERDSDENIADADFPEGNKPASIYGWEEGFAGWQNA